MQADEPISQQDLLGRWMHAHEEDPQDTSGREVYRPHDWSFGPSRGRRGFDLLPDGRRPWWALPPRTGRPIPARAGGRSSRPTCS